VNGANVRVIQRRSGLGLALETFERRAIVGQLLRKKFQGNGTMEACVLGLINNAHSSTAELFDDAVVRNRAAKYWRGIGHWRCMLRPAPQWRQSCNRGRIGPDRRASRKPRSKRAERLLFSAQLELLQNRAKNNRPEASLSTQPWDKAVVETIICDERLMLGGQSTCTGVC
jgi:hypothetical protein